MYSKYSNIATETQISQRKVFSNFFPSFWLAAILEQTTSDLRGIGRKREVVSCSSFDNYFGKLTHFRAMVQTSRNQNINLNQITVCITPMTKWHRRLLICNLNEIIYGSSVFFTHFAGSNQLRGFSVGGALNSNGLIIQ